MGIDVLAICAHPDDAELTCAGLLLLAKRTGASIGICNLTRGEMGTRGTPEEREREAAAAAGVLGLDARENLELPDGLLEVTVENRIKLVSVIRAHKPRMLLAPYWEDHHPDHAATSLLAKQAWWSAGLVRHPGGPGAHRPEMLLHYMGRYQFQPSVIIDVSEVWEQKLEAIRCYASQFHVEGSAQPATFISSTGFLDFWEGRHRYYGGMVGAAYAEPYLTRAPVSLSDPMALLSGRRAVL